MKVGHLRESYAAVELQAFGNVRDDRAALGRRAANATLQSSHAVDQATSISLAMDLTPLVTDDSLSVSDFTLAHIERLRADVAGRIAAMGG